MKIKSQMVTGCFIALNLIVLFIPAYCFSQTMDCENTLAAWRLDPNMKEYAEKCKCRPGCNNCEPKCEEASSTSGSSTSSGQSGGGQNIGRQIGLSIFKTGLDKILQGIFASPDNSKQEQLDEEEKQRQLAEQRAEEQRTKEALLIWQQRQSEGDLKKQMEAAAKIKQGADAFSKIQSVGGGGQGGLQPFSIGGDPKLDIKPVSQKTYPTPKSEWDRLLCTAYFSNLATKSTKDIEARFYADQAQKVMLGEPTDCECRMPKVSNEKIAKKMEEVNKLYNAMGAIINDLQDVDRQMLESKDKKKKAEVKKEEATVKLNELQNRAVTAGPEEKAEVDDLIRLAREQSQDADQEINQAQQADNNALNKKEQLEKEYNNLQDQMKSKVQTGDK